MEIGTEISRKIRGAIKGKLEELGAYIDEELPDYIMVMVANKKSQEQMTDDLSLFLGSSTSKFTIWLHGVLEKLRSATSDPNSQKSTDAIIFESSMSSCKAIPEGSNHRFPDDPHVAVSRTASEHHDPPVSTSLLGQSSSFIGHHSDESSAARPTSAVKPLRDFAPSEAIIDIQPNVDDLIDEDLNFIPETPVLLPEPPTAALAYGSSRPTAALYRPPGSTLHHYQGPDLVARSHRLPQSSVQSDNAAEVQSCRQMETIKQYDAERFNKMAETHRTTTKSTFERNAQEEETFQKRRLPSISSVVQVKQVFYDGEEEEEEDEDEDDNGSWTASLPSSVSVPAKPERRPTLPLSKQANKNLILKAISEAQKSVSKSTNYSTAPQKQTVPVAPRTRLTQDDPVMQLIRAQNVPSRANYLTPVEPSRANYLTQVEPARASSLTPVEPTRTGSHTQMEPSREHGLKRVQDVYDISQSFDSRSFILKRPKLSDKIVPKEQFFAKVAEDVVEVQTCPERIIQSREPPRSEKLENPKFIVTLDGVPSPPGYASDQEEEMELIEEGERISMENSKALLKKQKKLQVLQRISRQPMNSDGEDDDGVPVKQTVHERCKYWPACKNGDTCVYHHPTTPCKMFPKCKFAEKCLFIHPNCKYDAKCTKSDCPYTHASRRTTMPALKPEVASVGHVTYCRYDVQCTKPDCPYMHASQLHPVPPTTPAHVLAPSSTVTICRFFPSCKKMECPFYHPKLCRYNTQCHRPDCAFYHPSSTVPPRHALKWTRAQTSE